MEYKSPNNSTYSAIFAVLLVVLIIAIITYNAVQKIYNDSREMREERKNKKVVVEGLPEDQYWPLTKNDKVLHDNLTDEEADRIIREILESGEKNTEKLEKLETQF